MSPAITTGTSGMPASLPGLGRSRARALAATCALVLVGLALGTAEHAVAQCPEGARCGKVTVPLDRSNPPAGTIDIAYALLPRRDTTRPSLGTVLPNPGGPGSPAIAEAAAWSELLGPLRRRRDVLLIDPRGTGQSGALTCPSLAAQDATTIDLQGVATTCGGDLGARSRYYGSAAIADDFTAVRSALGIGQVDLWGQSWGTYLMPVYAARYPESVRSIVLSGAYPLAFDPWGRDLLRGSKRVIRRVCRRTRECSGRRVLRNLSRLVRRVRRRPVTFSAPIPDGRIRLAIGERELASLAFGRLQPPSIYGLLPAAVGAAIDHDYALLKRVVATIRLSEIYILTALDPSISSVGSLVAATCHDYPHPFDISAPPQQRQAEFDRALATIGREDFRPFRPAAWFQSGIWAAPACLGWPEDPTAGSPLQGRQLPDVPVLVQSGDLDTNTPIEQGRQTAAQFPHATFAIIANAGHTPDTEPCGAAMAIDFIRNLRTDPDRCRRAGSPPTVVDRPARRAAGLPPPAVRAPAPVRRAVAVALATIADAQAVAEFAQIIGRFDALRAGDYVATKRGLRIEGARVVRDAAANGTLKTRPRGTRTRLRLRGRGVPPARLTLRSTRRTTRITGTVAGRRVALRVPATH
jgi:pimeloyl-ACP methyl ester carboxylesterase